MNKSPGRIDHYVAGVSERSSSLKDQEYGLVDLLQEKHFVFQ
ncbi:hypothetical protein PSI22_08380 [Xenorhabdus sp. XENO-7]|uniref:Uncharacterized protein n=1 Tax=Xenorhabdus aichiensis TaxID=3025874 RepID=A0ABT5M1U1_9GAMM|nr:hypothetical protein [Xenorhabdus aichiensis]